METIISRLKKVKELADRGESGEAIAAKNKLLILLEKHNLTLEDIIEDKKKDYKFKYVYSREKSIMLHCISKVTDNPNLEYSHYKNKKKEFFVKLTEWQYIESKDLINFHVSQFRKETEKKMKFLLSAYMNKHHLFAESAESSGKEMTPEEYAEFLKAYSGLSDNETYIKKLNS